jgi:putative membrane protein
MTTLKFSLAVAAVCMLGTLSFAQNSATTTEPDPAHNTNTPNAPAVTNATVAQLSDAEVAHIVKTADEGEIDAAKVAVKKTKNNDVKAFANMMIKEHKENEKETKSIAKKGKFKAKDNDISKDLKKDAKESIAQLKKLKGAEFDKAYMTGQVAMHERVLNDLQTKLIPAAKNADLKAQLEATKTHVESHLAKARDLEIAVSK